MIRYFPILFLSLAIHCSVEAQQRQIAISGTHKSFIVKNNDTFAKGRDPFAAINNPYGNPYVSGRTVSTTDLVAGGQVSVVTEYRSRPVEISLGYWQGESTVFRPITQRYNILPVETLYLFNPSERFRYSVGFNIVMQYRTILFSGAREDWVSQIPDDRLLSFGAGVSGRAILILDRTLELRRVNTFLSVSGRWSEFLAHNSRGRDTSDFRYRHIVISPQLGFNIKL